MNSVHPENPVEPAVAVPIDASGSGTAVIIRNLVLQLVGAAGLLIGLLGLGDASVIVKVYKFASSEQFVPVLGVISAIGASGYQLYRALRKHRQVQTLASLPSVPNEVAIGPLNPTPAVEKAVEAAVAVENRIG